MQHIDEKNDNFVKAIVEETGSYSHQPRFHFFLKWTRRGFETSESEPGIWLVLGFHCGSVLLWFWCSLLGKSYALYIFQVKPMFFLNPNYVQEEERGAGEEEVETFEIQETKRYSRYLRYLRYLIFKKRKDLKILWVAGGGKKQAESTSQLQGGHLFHQQRFFTLSKALQVFFLSFSLFKSFDTEMVVDTEVREVWGKKIEFLLAVVRSQLL